jgi:hypothetical protein
MELYEKTGVELRIIKASSQNSVAIEESEISELWVV